MPTACWRKSPSRAPRFSLSTINGFQARPDGKWQYHLDADRKIGYLHINQFGSRTAAEVRETIEALQKMA